MQEENFKKRFTNPHNRKAWRKYKRTGTWSTDNNFVVSAWEKLNWENVIHMPTVEAMYRCTFCIPNSNMHVIRATCQQPIKKTYQRKILIKNYLWIKILSISWICLKCIQLKSLLHNRFFSNHRSNYLIVLLRSKLHKKQQIIFKKKA